MPKSVKACFLALLCGMTFADVGAQETGAVRLVDGSGSYEGRVEIFYDSQWGTVCDDYWDIADATVVCRQLGFANATDVFRHAYFGGGKPDQPIYLDDVHCNGNETELTDCEHRGWGIEDCIHYEDAGVRCYVEQNEGDVRLADGPTSRDGRLEIYHNNEWGTVCSTTWGPEEAEVTCRQLGNDGVNNEFYSPTPGNGSVHLSFVDCNGNETELVSSMEGDIRLTWDSSETFGQLQIYHGNSWGTVCSDGWDPYNTRVVCRQLGYTSVGVLYESIPDPGFIGPVHLSEVNCTGDEIALSHCPHNGWGDTGCRHTKDLRLHCPPDITAEDGDVRLVDGDNSWEGRLQVFHDLKWGTVCNDSWSYENALVVCHQLGFEGVVTPYRDFGPGYGPIHIGGVVCTGKEHTLTNCSHSEWGASGCIFHEQDVGVHCTEQSLTGEEGELRLRGGPLYGQGRVEIFHDFQWGTICDDGWSKNESLVACRQLGFDGAVTAIEYFGAGKGPIHLDEVSCTGSEWRLEECSHDGWGAHDCSHYEDVGIYCSYAVTEPGEHIGLFGWVIALIVIASVGAFAFFVAIIACLCSMKEKPWRVASSGIQVSGQTMPTGHTNSVALAQNGAVYYNPNGIPLSDGASPPDYSEAMADSPIPYKQPMDTSDPSGGTPVQAGGTDMSTIDIGTMDSS
ncbi:scavenger receptor cysteine-rich domain superfamily protein-like [Diadema antillarum]|uniref:scavenger receptor cysteine-rich domain superfamily protein-like n=1 Tax=Diadema antillarum TaxID=105358 RepID=UPI003A83CD9D